ncbi:MAG: carcinine hydrolase/isopenicillin-N N-acyltransferase family protein [Candidatus Aminicenantales bacterium]
MKKERLLLRLLLLFSVLFVCYLDGLPCTVAAVSGKATPDGRPLLWKNRDTTAVANKVVYVKGEKYGFIALINAGDVKIENAWAGINSEGFAIMNAASSDLATGEEAMNDNGRFMREALGRCADVSDFERLLNATEGKRRVGANFGVIDARGNASIYETSSTSHVKFDTNDPRVAPQGYIIRTNFAYTSQEKDGGGGYIRFERASRLFEAAYAEKGLDFRFILQQAARDLVNEKLHSYPLSRLGAHDPSSPVYINTNDTINRNSTVSAVLFQGAPSEEKAYLATMWVILGQPICSVALPLWAHAGVVPEVLDGAGTSALNDLSRALGSFLYPDRRGHMVQYLNVSRLLQYGGQGVLHKLYGIENQIFTRTRARLKQWKDQKPSKEEMASFEEKMAKWAFESLRNAFPDIKAKD